MTGPTYTIELFDATMGLRRIHTYTEKGQDYPFTYNKLSEAKEVRDSLAYNPHYRSVIILKNGIPV